MLHYDTIRFVVYIQRSETQMKNQVSIDIPSYLF